MSVERHSKGGKKAVWFSMAQQPLVIVGVPAHSAASREMSCKGQEGNSYCKFAFLGQSTGPISIDFTMSFSVVTSDLYLVHFVPP